LADTDVDVLVVGGGLAGLTAGLFAARYGRSTLVLTGGAPGGPLLSITRIEDYPGFADGVAGFDLCPIAQEQAAAAGAAFRMDELTGLGNDGDTWLAATDSGQVGARSVIVATGSSLRELGVPGESRLSGRGISHCASCDGPLYRERTVGVVGGGDSALQEALELAEYAEVILFHRGASFTGQEAYQRRVLESPRIRVCFETTIEEILGEAAVEGVTTRNAETGDTAVVELAALFPYIGTLPRTAFLAGTIRLDAEGRIPTDGGMRTEARGLFAAGDVRSDSAAHAVAVAGDGATAAASAHRFLNGAPWASLHTSESEHDEVDAELTARS
jgi:thioredoxin reductase (NADPH)